ncbi:hypothetical protein [Oligoflexus tunisiensis]|uniref:hypothetical protein n=1 Tax=Oligoflexus tunisiensis TaxID=708132 RepID=UPI00114CB3D8|nr:hypothetical protein [Oligoflexus tunisiensis]
MKIVPILGSIIIPALSMTSVVLAGGLAGGGGPPSKKMLEQMLETQPGRAALFVWDEQTYGLGIDKSLVPAILLTKGSPADDALPIAAEDFQKLETKEHPVNVINREGVTRSYRVLDGQQNGTLLLVDRRLLIRAGTRP